MNDYEFGNRLYELRVKSKLSQTELANLLNVTNKAVSKWENGKSKPNVDTLNKIALLFKISIQDLLNGNKVKPNINTIVITGGPCAGKSTALSWIQNEFSKRGYHVMFIVESATEVINGGMGRVNCVSTLEFQRNILSLQMEKEKIYKEAALKMEKDKILIVCDRGALDSKAYMSNLDFATLLRQLNTNEIELRDNYDAVFHLVSAAKGASEFYTLENNSARSENVEEAIISDDKTLKAWMGHPHLRVIDNSTDFNTKIQRLIKEISSFLGEPEPFEIERKFLIEYPNIKLLESLDNCEKVEIIQTYLLKDKADEEVRIRQRGKDGNYIYYKTIKKKINELKRMEIEKRLSKDEYLTLLMKQDSDYKQIKKDRYCLMHKGIYFEIDIYPFWSDKAIMEVELKDEDEEFEIPDFIEVIKEVSEDKEYKNINLAKIKKDK